MIIDILTTTRADYGTLRPIIKKMSETEDLKPELLVTGTHLLEEYGLTVREIEKDGFPIAKKISILSKNEGVIGVSETMANAIEKFSKYFFKHHPDFLMVDGDRYETLAICLAAVNSNIPIIHIGGGAITKGAVDDYYRHAITKLSYLHFATMEPYKKRIIQMGENPNRVFLVGSPLIENILNTKFLTKKELESSINFKLDMPFAVVTFHPVTLENQTALEQIDELLKACKETKSMKFIFTLSNADNGGDIINKEIVSFTNSFDRAICVKSLGSLRYYSALNYAKFVIGNSSSGIIEVPTFHIPTINIGNRQGGRLQAKSIINCKPNSKDITEAINIATSKAFCEKCKSVKNPNGDGKTSVRIIEAIRKSKIDGIDLQKTFYDIGFEEK